MAQLLGIVTDITYQNEENGFTVLRLQAEHDESCHTCVGMMPTVDRGMAVSVAGCWETAPRYGPQFRVESYQLVRPTTLKGIQLLLSSGLISNIGPHRAEKIISHFGIDTLQVLDSTPQRLTEVSGIGKKTLQKIIEGWQRERHLRDLMLFLQDFGVSLNLISKIYRTYGDTAREVISANPYALIDDIWGVGFRRADAIAQKMGFAHDSYRRIRAGIVHVLQESAGEGHSYLPRGELLAKASELLQAAQEQVVFSLDNTVAQKTIIREEDRLYLPRYYHAECAVAERLREQIRVHSRPVEGAGDRESVAQWLQEYCRRSAWQADPVQAAAIETAICRGLLLLTGGPGTGKTTTLQAIVSFYRERGVRIALAAPTGRAAQRMGTVAGLGAKTIHRLLEFRPLKGGMSFGRNRERPLEAEVVILDEVSMVDLLLMRNLLEAVAPRAALILVGDSNQLPSVGTGNVLADLMAGGCIPHVNLTTIFRQAASSRIVTAAHQIIRGDVPRFANAPQDNCFFLEREEPQQVLQTVIDLVAKRLPSRYGIDPVRDIQVLAPMHRGQVGTQILNQMLQQTLNRSTRRLVRGDRAFSPGDKVMQVQNNYDRGVFNGDIGYVIEVADDTGMSVAFDERAVHYEPRELDELVHAYCISIHKSQGCEFPVVIIPLVTQHFIMLQRNLIYTALTRARKLCVMVGTSRALGIAVRNDESHQRYSRLSERMAC
jgi:exodeoxyribonuclease V alpha subunit